MRSFVLLITLIILSACLVDSESWAIRHSVMADKEQTEVVPSQAGKEEVNTGEDVNLFSSTLKMIGSLAFVLAGILVTYWVVKKFLLKNSGVFSGGHLIRTLATSYLGQKKSVSIVEVAGELLILGVTSNHISLLTKIEDKERVEEIKGTAGQRNSQSSFEYQFKRMSSRLKGNRGKNLVSDLTNSVRHRVSKLRDM
ncbi:MAG: flagellar biosynthetic protein FliO [Thermodesulfobacteriota bacterium]|nr:flagellar biosynthetic protein FliO [Thermodesulfobacteriota bacterium]